MFFTHIPQLSQSIQLSTYLVSIQHRYFERSANHHRPFAEIDKRLGLEMGDSWKFLEKEGLFERAVFMHYSRAPHPRTKLKLVVDTRK